MDDAEHESRDAFALNGVAPEVIALEAAKSGGRLLHVSTDYVFDGAARAPYTTNGIPSPISIYGASKLAGETAVLRVNPNACVVRTAWVHSGHGTNFVATAVRLLSEGKSMRVVDDQVSTPTHAAHLAQFLWTLVVQRDISGLQHFTDAGVASWYDVAQCVLETLRTLGKVGADVAVTPVDSNAFPRPAARPPISVLDKHSTWTRAGYLPRHWREGVIASTRALTNA